MHKFYEFTLVAEVYIETEGWSTGESLKFMNSSPQRPKDVRTLDMYSTQRAWPCPQTPPNAQRGGKVANNKHVLKWNAVQKSQYARVS